MEPDGITLATVLAIELAIFATTPFFELRFFAFVRVFGAALDLVFAFCFAAFLAINDSATASLIQITLILSLLFIPTSAPRQKYPEHPGPAAVQFPNHENSHPRRAPPAHLGVCLVQARHATRRA